MKKIGVWAACAAMITLPSFAYNDILDLTFDKGVCYVSADGKGGENLGCESGVYESLGAGQWAATFSDNGAPISVIGNSWCSKQEPGVEDKWTPADGGAQYEIDAEYSEYYSKSPSGVGDICYCKMNTPGFSEWLYFNSLGDGCTSDCASSCAKSMTGDDPSVMFRSVAGVDKPFTYLYNTTGTGDFCAVEGDGSGLDCDKIGVTTLGGWAAVLDNKYDKENPAVLVTGDAWLYGTLYKQDPYQPAPAARQAAITAEYNTGKPVGPGMCFCRLRTPAESLWVYNGELDNLQNCSSKCAGTTGNYSPKDTPLVESMFRTLKTTQVEPGDEPGDNPQSGGISYDYLLKSLPTGNGHWCFIAENGDINCNSDDYFKQVEKEKYISKPGQWIVEYQYNKTPFNIIGSAWATETAPDDKELQNSINKEYAKFISGAKSNDGNGPNCYCRMDSPASSDWIWSGGQSDFTIDKCAQLCTEFLGKNSGGEDAASRVAKSMMSTAKSGGAPFNAAIPTSKYYVDTELAKLQDIFAGVGIEQILMTYSGDVGVVDKRTINNSELNDTDGEVPTRGLVASGVQRKQDTVNGTANWAMTYGNTAGTFGSKPIYNTVNNNYNTSLVGAETLNTAIINAVNSEFTPVENVGFLINGVNNIELLHTVTQP